MAKPSIRELLDKVREAFDREETVAGLEMLLIIRIERVLALHRKACDNPEDDCGCVVCGGFGWPCPTVRALEGEE